MSIESKGGKRELVGDPDILNILVFGDIWITQSTSCVCFIYDQMFTIIETPLETLFQLIT